MNESLMHYGTPRHSGRYPYGSGERPFQRDGGSRRAYSADKTSKAVEEIVSTLSLEEKRKLGIRDNEKQYLTYEEGSHVVKRILEKDGDTPVSFCDVFDEGKTATMAVATRADSNYRGKGYATKAAKKGLNWYAKNKDRLGYESLEWLTRKDNQSSMRIAKELGFKEKPGYVKKNDHLWKTYYVHSDEGGEDFMYVDELLDRSDELMHYGTPRHSGRYPWGSGERPFQGDNVSFKPSVKKYVVGRKTTRANKEAMDKAVRDIRDYLYTLTPIPDSDYKKLEKGINIPGDSNGYYEGKKVVAASTYNKFKRTLDKYENKVNKLDVVDDKTFTKLVMKQIDRKEALAGAISAAAVATPLMLLTMSDTDESNYIATLADKADDLEHGGPGSGRFPWGSGERPYQHRTPAGFMLPAHTGSYHQGHKSTRESKSSGSSNPSSSSSSSSSNTGASSQYDAYKAEEAQYKRNEERRKQNEDRRKQQRHDADMADRARKIRKEDAKEKTDKAKAEEKERETLEDAYWDEVTKMTNQLASVRTHVKNLRAASKPVKDVTKKMSDQQLRELTDRLKLENSYLRELNTRQGYNARPDKVENLLGLLGDVSSMGRSASKVYRTTVKQRKYL